MAKKEKKNKQKLKVSTFKITPIAWIVFVISILINIGINFNGLIKGAIGFVIAGSGIYIIMRKIEFPTEKDLAKIKKENPEFYKKHKKEIEDL